MTNSDCKYPGYPTRFFRTDDETGFALISTRLARQKLSHQVLLVVRRLHNPLCGHRNAHRVARESEIQQKCTKGFSDKRYT